MFDQDGIDVGELELVWMLLLDFVQVLYGMFEDIEWQVIFVMLVCYGDNKMFVVWQLGISVKIIYNKFDCYCGCL